MTNNSQAKTADGKQLDALLATDTQSAVQTSAMKSMSALHSKTKPGDSQKSNAKSTQGITVSQGIGKSKDKNVE